MKISYFSDSIYGGYIVIDVGERRRDEFTDDNECRVLRKVGVIK